MQEAGQVVDPREHDHASGNSGGPRSVERDAEDFEAPAPEWWLPASGDEFPLP